MYNRPQKRKIKCKKNASLYQHEGKVSWESYISYQQQSFVCTCSRLAKDIPRQCYSKVCKKKLFLKNKK